jgi:hypothetical protein
MSPMLMTMAPGRRGDLHPGAVLGQQFQTRFLRAQQQGDEVDVLMRAGADGAFGGVGDGG